PPCIRVFSTALAFEPAAPATAWFTISTPGWLFSKIAYICFRPASSPPVVHQENISSLPLPVLAAAAGAVVAPAAAAGAAGLAASVGFGAAAVGAVAAGWALPQAASSEFATARPAPPRANLRNDRRSRRCSRPRASEKRGSRATIAPPHRPAH